MSDITINNLPTASTIDATADYLPIYTASSLATQKITRNTYLGLSSAPVGLTDTQTLTNKILSTTNTITQLDGTFSLKNTSDATKIGKFSLANITTGNTRTYTLPDASVTLSSLTGTETLTNKTLTSPTINSPTITNATLSADAITGYSASTTGTIYGVSVASGVIASAALNNAVNTAALQSSAITTAKINNAAVTADKLGTGAAYAVVATAQTTSSTSFTDLATPGPAVTVTIGANGLAFVTVSADLTNNTLGDFAVMGFALSGANSVSPTTSQSLYNKASVASNTLRMSYSVLLTGLTAGSTTFTAKYECIVGGTSTFTSREINVIPL